METMNDTNVRTDLTRRCADVAEKLAVTLRLGAQDGVLEHPECHRASVAVAGRVLSVLDEVLFAPLHSEEGVPGFVGAIKTTNEALSGLWADGFDPVGPQNASEYAAAVRELQLAIYTLAEEIEAAAATALYVDTASPEAT